MGIWRKLTILTVASGDYNLAARYLVVDQAYQRPPINIWRWWKRSFAKRADSAERWYFFVAAIFDEYHDGGKLFRETVAAIFGMEKGAAKLPVEQFIESVRRNNACNYPLPESQVLIAPAAKTAMLRRGYRSPTVSITRHRAGDIDLRRDAAQLRKLMKQLVRLQSRAMTKLRTPPVSAVEAGFYLCQSGWLTIHFDQRPQHARDGEWTAYVSRERVKMPQWKKDHDHLQRDGGSITLENGTKLKINAGVSCQRLAAIYGGMIRRVLTAAGKSDQFRELAKTPECQIDIEEFDGNWAWPKFEQLGKVNLIRPRRVVRGS